jgi:hypothetical protein
MLFAPFATLQQQQLISFLLGVSCLLLLAPAFLITALDSRIAPYQKRGEPVDLLAHTLSLAFPPQGRAKLARGANYSI